MLQTSGTSKTTRQAHSQIEPTSTCLQPRLERPSRWQKPKSVLATARVSRESRGHNAVRSLDDYNHCSHDHCSHDHCSHDHREFGGLGERCNST